MSPSAIQLTRFEPVGMVVLHDQTLTADTANFDVTDIPQGYKHLRIVLYARGTTAATSAENGLRFNNDSGSNYDREYVAGLAATPISGENLAQTSMLLVDMPANSASADRFGVQTIDIPNYASTVGMKAITSLGANIRGTATQEAVVAAIAGLWRSTSAINRITLTPSAGNYKAGSRLTIYGLGGAPVAETLGVDGWTTDPATWTYATASTFTVAGDQVSKFSRGTRIKLTQTTVKYFAVTGSTHSSGTTTVTVTGGSDYSLANAAITNRHYSYAINPLGYPSVFSWTPTYGGFSSNTTVMYFSIIGRMCHLLCYTSGTSNATTFTFTLPVTPLSTEGHAVRGINSGTELTAPSMVYLVSGVDANVYRSFQIGGTAWTASGTKQIEGSIHYLYG